MAMTSCLPKKEGGSGASESPRGEIYVLSDPAAERGVGWTMVTTSEVLTEDHPATVKVGAQTQQGTISSKLTKRTVYQNLGRDRWRVTVQRDTNSFSRQIVGLPTAREAIKGPLIGQYVILELRNGFWEGRFENGAQPTAVQREQIKDLAAEMRTRHALVTPTEHRIGEEWELEASQTGFGAGSEGTVQFRFDRVEEHRGEQCAVLTGSLALTGAANDNGGQVTDYKITGTFTVYRSLRHFVDLDTEITGTSEMKISPQLGMTVTTSGPMRWVERSEVTEPAAQLSRR